MKRDKKALTQEEYIRRVKECHKGQNLDFSKTVYVNMHTKVTITDLDINPKTGEPYGDYTTLAMNLVKGVSHPARSGRERLTTEEYIKRAKAAHPGENLDYSKTVYKNMHTKVCVIDHDINPRTGKEYGEYWQYAQAHVNGCGHPEKGDVKGAILSRVMDFKEFVRRAKNAHKGENIEYIGYEGLFTLNSKVKIIDHDINPLTGKEYGEYIQMASKHLRGRGHTEKGHVIAASKRLRSSEEVLFDMKQAHPEFDFSRFDFKGIEKNVTIGCKKHGWFETTPYVFIHSAHGCPMCAAESGISIREKDLYEFVSSLIGENVIKRNDRELLSGKEIDMLIEPKRIGIEFDGLRYHSDEFGKSSTYHINKTEWCKEKGIRLIHVFEDEWRYHKDLVKDKLSYILGCSKDRDRIGARKCEIREIYKSDSDVFLEKNHIQGKANASAYWGAFYQGKLVSVMLFKKTGKDREYELNRFASDTQYVIQGIASRLLKYFIRMGLAKSIISFVDLRWTDENNNMYLKLGFSYVSRIKPKFYYTQGDRRFSIHQIIKKNMGKLPKYASMNDLLSHFSKIYDCGQAKYRLQIK